MKKNIFYFVLGAIIFSGMTVFAATIIQSNLVTYDNTDSGMSATNVKDALDYFYTQSEQPQPTEPGFDLTKFENGKVVEGIAPISYSGTLDGWNISSSSIEYDFDSTSDFEITLDTFWENDTNDLMGGLGLYFYLNNTVVGKMRILDHHVDYIDCYADAKLNSTEVNGLQIADPTDCSGRYSMVRKKGVLDIYLNNNSIYSTNFTDEFQFDRIDAIFFKYQNYNIVKASIKNIYIGNIINYTE